MTMIMVLSSVFLTALENESGGPFGAARSMYSWMFRCLRSRAALGVSEIKIKARPRTGQGQRREAGVPDPHALQSSTRSPVARKRRPAGSFPVTALRRPEGQQL